MVRRFLKTEGKGMDIKRYDTILFNAIDLLLQTMNREQIIEELSMSKSEFEAVGGLMETPNKK